MYDIIQFIGWIGAAGVLTAYALTTAGRIAATSVAYLLVNFTCAIALGMSTALAHAWPSTTVNVLWLVIGMLPLVRAIRARRRSRERLRQVGDEVGDVLDTDREPHQVFANL
jgi:hypothetical protein